MAVSTYRSKEAVLPASPAPSLPLMAWCAQSTTSQMPQTYHLLLYTTLRTAWSYPLGVWSLFWLQYNNIGPLMMKSLKYTPAHVRNGFYSVSFQIRVRYEWWRGCVQTTKRVTVFQQQLPMLSTSRAWCWSSWWDCIMWYSLELKIMLFFATDQSPLLPQGTQQLSQHYGAGILYQPTDSVIVLLYISCFPFSLFCCCSFIMTLALLFLSLSYGVSIFVSVSQGADNEPAEWTDAPLSKKEERSVCVHTCTCMHWGEGTFAHLLFWSTVCTTSDEGDWRLPEVHIASKSNV